ncbi:MAG: acyl-CoA dehydrogenase family protein [Burkholderiaceae bacterium]
MQALTLYDPMVSAAAERLFAGLAPEALASAARGEPAEALREAVDDAGFASALGGLDARDDWPVAAALLRAQGRHAAPYDLADALIANALAPEPDDAASAAATDARRNHAFALARCIQIAGALDASLSMSTRYVLDRKQFGRPLAAFQAIQHQLAIAAEKMAAAQAATDLALSALCTEGLDGDRTCALIDAAGRGERRRGGLRLRCQPPGPWRHRITREYALHHHS